MSSNSKPIPSITEHCGTKSSYDMKNLYGKLSSKIHQFDFNAEFSTPSWLNEHEKCWMDELYLVLCSKNIDMTQANLIKNGFQGALRDLEEEDVDDDEESEAVDEERGKSQ